MYMFNLITAAVALSVAYAQTTTTSAAATTTTDLIGLVSELPSCALECLSTAASTIDCNAADLTCLCGKATQFATAIGPCILTSTCDTDQQNGKSFLSL